MDTYERIEMLEDAREHLQQALDLIREAVDDTPCIIFQPHHLQKSPTS